MSNHFLLCQTIGKLECDVCGMDLIDKVNLSKHMTEKHHNKENKSVLLDKLKNLFSKINNQKSAIHRQIYKLKQQEAKDNGRCQCRGNLCRINHFKYRWTFSKADEFFNQLTSISEEICFSKEQCVNIQCQKCLQECEKLRDIDEHIAKGHETGISSSCEQCGEMFDKENDMRRHIKIIQENNIIGCEFCDKTFQNEGTLGNHNKAHHGQSLLNLTFMNPSLINSK